MTVELKEELRKAHPGYTLEMTAETFAELQDGLAGIRTVTTAIKAIIPPHLAERLDACTAKSLLALGLIEVVREEREGAHEYDPGCDCANCAQETRNMEGDRRYDEAVDRALENASPTLAEVNLRRGFVV